MAIMGHDHTLQTGTGGGTLAGVSNMNSDGNYGDDDNGGNDEDNDDDNE